MYQLLLHLTFVSSIAVVSSVGHNSTAEKRIIWGVDADIRHVRYHVVLMEKGIYENEAQFCGGTILNSEWILTCAHCLCARRQPSVPRNVNHMSVLVGHDNLNRINRSLRYAVAEVFPHEDYTQRVDPETYPYDIGLVRLAERLVMSDRVGAALLPTEDMDPWYNSFFIAGFGFTSNEYQGSMKLKSGFVKVNTQTECIAMYGHVVYSETRNLCVQTSFYQVYPCSGDSGSGLIIPNFDAPHVMGIYAGGDKPCNKSRYNIAVRVSSYLDWIKSKTGLEPTKSKWYPS